MLLVLLLPPPALVVVTNCRLVCLPPAGDRLTLAPEGSGPHFLESTIEAPERPQSAGLDIIVLMYHVGHSGSHPGQLSSRQ